VIVVDFRDRNIENIIELQWQPAESKDNDHDNKHFDDLRVGRKKRKLNCKQICIRIPPSNSPQSTHLFLVFQQGYIPGILCIARGTSAPQTDSHLDVDKADDTEWNQILHKDQGVPKRLQLIIG